ncbi:MAG: hypothetical protein RLZZ358_359 [Bacteroidota bacterium]|jgi:hypothetical protein
MIFLPFKTRKDCFKRKSHLKYLNFLSKVLKNQLLIFEDH